MATRQCLIQTLGEATIAFLSLALTIPSISAAAPPPPIINKNHTVGDAAGWFFNTSSNATSGNYSDWAASQTFYLGDYLIFNTNTNSNVVQTNNETAYSLCDASMDDNAFIWGNGGGDTNSSTPAPEVIAIALVLEGSNYFFSNTMDGEQCMMGMKLGINVLHGNGLPPALNHPPPPAYATPPALATNGGGGGPSHDQSSQKNGVDRMRGRTIWIGMGILSLVLMAV